MTEFREFPAPPQAKSRESEATPERERTSIFQWLRDRGYLVYLGAALALSPGVFTHERLEAAEIPPHATWSEGIERLQKGVLSDKVETLGTFYIDHQNHREKWILRKEGTSTRVEVTNADVADALEAELSASPAQSVTVCYLHTHPLGSGDSADPISAIISTEERQNIRDGKHSVSLPPSDTDIDLRNIYEQETLLGRLKEKGVTAEARQGVIDAAGITYYRPINDQDIKQEFPKYFAELEQRKAIWREWEEAVNSAVDNLTPATVHELHHRIPMPYDRYVQLFKGAYPEKETLALKRRDIKEAVVSGDLIEKIGPVLFAGNPKGQKLQHAFETLVVEKQRNDEERFYEVAEGWVRKSLAVSPGLLTTTKDYTELREAYARSGAYIRFTPHQNVPNEPPCAGTDYKP